jgi:hypothetical protein
LPEFQFPECEAKGHWLLQDFFIAFPFVEQPGIPTCGPTHMFCHDSTVAALVSEEIEGCNCLPGCTTIMYESEVTVGKLNMSAVMEANDKDTNEFNFFNICSSNRFNTVFFQV